MELYRRLYFKLLSNVQSDNVLLLLTPTFRKCPLFLVVPTFSCPSSKVLANSRIWPLQFWQSFLRWTWEHATKSHYRFNLDDQVYKPNKYTVLDQLSVDCEFQFCFKANNLLQVTYLYHGTILEHCYIKSSYWKKPSYCSFLSKAEVIFWFKESCSLFGAVHDVRRNIHF